MLAAMALFAVLGWSPAFMMRRFALTPADSGLWLGVIAIMAGGGGCLASGWIMDAMTQRGVSNAPFRTGIIGASGTFAAAALIPLASTPLAGGLLLGLALFFASFPMPPAAAVIQIAAPGHLRSRVSAVFIFFNAPVGLALGNGLIGYLNDHAFGDPGAVGVSMAIVTAVAGLLSALTLSAGLGPFAAPVERASA
jgi:MFS family permease